MKKGQAVLVTTEFRGVFFGKIESSSKFPDQLTLTDARNCIYWSSDCGGFLGLASDGPTSDCRIGHQVAEITLIKITSLTPVTIKAVKAWEKA